MSKKIKYVKHPVTAEQKAKLRSQGFKILDIKFQPAKPKAKSKAVEDGANS